MECSHCGTGNMDGADRCSSCGEPLGPEGAPGGGPSRSTWVLVGVVAVAAVVLVGIMLSAGGGGGGGGGAVPGGQETTGSAEATGSASEAGVTTTTPTPEQRTRVLEAAKPIVSAQYPELVQVEPDVVSYTYRGTAFVDAVYMTQVQLEGSAGPLTRTQSVVVSLEESTGKVSVYATD